MVRTWRARLDKGKLWGEKHGIRAITFENEDQAKWI
jgi:hypothetical protein